MLPWSNITENCRRQNVYVYIKQLFLHESVDFLLRENTKSKSENNQNIQNTQLPHYMNIENKLTSYISEVLFENIEWQINSRKTIHIITLYVIYIAKQHTMWCLVDVYNTNTNTSNWSALWTTATACMKINPAWKLC